MKHLKQPSLWKAVQNCSEADIQPLAVKLAQELRLGDSVFLNGPMGSGKSTFARAILLALKVKQPPEGSPSFAIAHEYEAGLGGVVHLDFFRLKSESEIEAAGIFSYYWEVPLLVISEWSCMYPEFEGQIISSILGRGSRVWQIDLSLERSIVIHFLCG